jgi:uncharacterized protein (TIGR03089 family)
MHPCLAITALDPHRLTRMPHEDRVRADFAAVWRERMAAGGPRPFLTFLDDTTGERVEVSYATFGNWLAKTANLIQDDLMAQHGDVIAVSAPPHWITAVWAVAPLLAGVAVAPWGDPAAAHTAIAYADDETLAAARACPGERLALSLLPLGRPFAVVPDGFRDYSAEVRAHGDHFVPFDAPASETAALVLGERTLTHRELVEAAADAARSAGLSDGDRVLVDARAVRFDGADLLEWLYAPLSAGASVVLVRGGDAERLDRIATTERATARLALG